MRCSLAVHKFAIRAFSLLALLSLLPGCAGGSPVTRYALSSPVPTSTPSNAASIVSIAEIRMPAYAQDKPIASQGEGREVQLDASNRWAGYPSELVTAALIQALRGQGVNALAAGQLSGIRPDRRAMVTLDSFLRNRDGGASITGSIAIVDAEEHTGSQNFAIDVPGNSTDYSDYVRAVEECVNRLAKTLADALQTHSSNSQG
jgi:uncharacterized lipoprotein YmbA